MKALLSLTVVALLLLATYCSDSSKIKEGKYCEFTVKQASANVLHLTVKGVDHIYIFTKVADNAYETKLFGITSTLQVIDNNKMIIKGKECVLKNE